MIVMGEKILLILLKVYDFREIVSHFKQVYDRALSGDKKSQLQCFGVGKYVVENLMDSSFWCLWDDLTEK